MNLSDIKALYTHRQSCRAFDGRPVPERLLQEICELALLAPSACNAQPWHLYAVTGEKVKDVAACVQGLGMNKFASDAGAFVVVAEGKSNLTARLGDRLKDQNFTPGDIGIMTAHLVLAAEAAGLASCILGSAEAAGLASCILGWRSEKKLRPLLGLPEEVRIPCVVALGYAKESDPIRPKKRKPTEETLTFLK